MTNVRGPVMPRLVAAIFTIWLTQSSVVAQPLPAGYAPDLHLQASLGTQIRPVVLMQYSADGSLLATGSANQYPGEDEQVVQIWDARTGRLVATPLHELIAADADDDAASASQSSVAFINGMTFSGDGTLLALSGTQVRDGGAEHRAFFQIHRTSDGSRLKTQFLPAGADGFSFARNRFLHVTGMSAGTRWLHTYDVVSKRATPTNQETSTVHPADAKPESARIAAALSFARVAMQKQLAWTRIIFDWSMTGERFDLANDARRVVTMGNDIDVWDAEHGCAVLRIDWCGGISDETNLCPKPAKDTAKKSPACDPADRVRDFRLLDAGRKLALLQGQRVAIWDVDNRSLLRVLDAPHLDAFRVLATAGANHLAIGGDWSGTVHDVGNGVVYAWDLATPTGFKTIAGQGRDCWSLDFSPDGRWLAVGGTSPPSAQVWSLATGTLARGYPVSGNPPLMAFMDHDRVLTVSGDQWEPDRAGGYEIWSIADGVRLGARKDVPRGRDGLGVLGSGSDWSILLGPRWSWGQGPLEIWRPNTDQTSALSGGNWLALPLGGQASDLSRPVAAAAGVSPSPTRIATLVAPNSVAIWHRDDPRVLQQIGIRTGRVGAVALGEDGQMVAVAINPTARQRAAGETGRVDFWTVPTGKAVRTMTSPAGVVVSALALSPDQTLVAAGLTSGRILLCAARSITHSPCKMFKAHKTAVGRLRFSTDGARLASGARDARVLLWRLSPPRNPVD